MIEIPDLDQEQYEEEQFRNFKFSNQQSYEVPDIDEYDDDDYPQTHSEIQESYQPHKSDFTDSTSLISDSDVIEVNTAVTSHVKQNSIDNHERLQLKAQEMNLDTYKMTQGNLETPEMNEHVAFDTDGPVMSHEVDILETSNIQEHGNYISNQINHQIEETMTENDINQKVIDNLPQVDDDIDIDIDSFDEQPSVWPSAFKSSHSTQLGELRKGLATDSKSPVEYTLHIVFTQFVRHAERKLNLCSDLPEPEIIDILSEGNDDQFDQCISSLGYIARQKPKPIIDLAMIWRRSKSDVALLAATEVDKVFQSARTNLGRAPSKLKRGLLRSKSLRVASTKESDEYGPSKQFYDDEMVRARDSAIHAERKSLAAIYILCRILIEVVKHTLPEVMGDDLGDKLEEIVYTQLKTTDPISTAASLLRSANWNLFAELLGHLSCKRFLTVSDRFIADLEKIPPKVHHDDEPRLHLLIHGMRYLKLTNYPLEVFEESAEFIESLAKFFNATENELILIAYCEVLASLLLPLANILTAETNHPTWTIAITTIYKKAHRIWRQSDSNDTKTISMSPNGNTGSLNLWECSVNLLTAALSVSHKELFQNWFATIEDNAFKLRPKVHTEEKITLITCTSRLLWVYIFRLNDTLNNTIKNLDALFQLLFFNTSNKKLQWITSDSYLMSALIEVIRIVGYKHLNYVLDNVLLRLAKHSFTGSLETLSPEKMMLVSRCYLRILQDYEGGRRPQFPAENSASGNNAEIPGHKSEPEFTFTARTADNHASHEEMCKYFGTHLKLLDGQYGSEIWAHTATPLSATFKSQPFFHFGDYSYQSTKKLHLEAFSYLIDTIPYTMLNDNSLCGISFNGLVELLTRNAVHTNYHIANSCVTALKKLSAGRNPTSLMILFGKFAFQFSEKPNPDYNTNYLNSPEFQKLLKLYVELLVVWLRQFKRDNDATPDDTVRDDNVTNDMLNDMYHVNYKAEDFGPNKEPKSLKTELEWKNIITAIEEIEGNGLFFLCNQDYQIRHFGISILRLVQQFDQEIYNIDKKDEIAGIQAEKLSHSRSSSKFAADTGSRLIDILDTQDFGDLIHPLRAELSTAERTRLPKWKSKRLVLVRLAESDNGIDTTLWFRVYPKLLDIFFDECPMPVAICRSIVCVRLVQMHEHVVEYSESYNKNYTSSLFLKPSQVPPEVLVDQWRLYLIFVCCSLTSTNEQKISFPHQPTHGRKRSMQMFIQHQKITSAKSIFRMVLPLLKSQQVMVRDGIIAGLSCININIFKTLLENVQSLNDWDETGKKRDSQEDCARIELVNILSKITTKYTGHDIIYGDDWIIANLVSIIKSVKSFLATPSVQIDINFQKLRRYFCRFLENVFVGLKLANCLDRWLPFEARIGCFNYLKEWCEFDSLSEQRYREMLAKLGSKELASSAAILEVERKVLQGASLSCMATICRGNIIEEIKVDDDFAVMSFDIPLLMAWINSLLCSQADNIVDIGKQALANILHINPENAEIYQEVLFQCYKAQETPKTTESYYTTFVDFLMNNPDTIKHPLDLYCLSSFLIGDDNVQIRQYSMKLLRFLELKFHQSNSVVVFATSVGSKNRTVYKKALFEISLHLASLYSLEAVERISYLTMCFNRVNNDMRRNILSCLLPWVQTVDLSLKPDDVASGGASASAAAAAAAAANASANANATAVANAVASGEGVQSAGGDGDGSVSAETLSPASLMVLNNLFEITVKYSSLISNEVEALWVALGSKPSNFEIIFEYIVTNSLERRNATFVQFSSQIIDYLSFAQSDINFMVDKLINNLQPKSMIPLRPHSVVKSAVSNTEFPYVANISELIPSNDREASLSLGQVSLIFLVDLFTTHNDRMIVHLPLLLHVSFVMLDHYLPVVQEAVATLLGHVLHAVAPTDPKTEIVLGKLSHKDPSKCLWVYDDLNNDKRGARTPHNMDLLVRNVLEILTPGSPHLQEEWSKVGLHWATTCAVRHLACRSFQVFRSLLSVLDQPMLKDMFHRLSNTIADDTPDIQGFAMQILMTLNAINAELDSEKLIDFPQLFWCGVACLSTVHEQEFIEVLSAMAKFVAKIDLDSAETVSCLISTFPPKWEGRFEGLQPVVMIGLRSATSYDQTVKFLDKLATLDDSEIIASLRQSRLLMTIVSNIPRFLHAFDNPNPETDAIAMTLSTMCERHGQSSLGKIFVSIHKGRFRSKKDLLVQTISGVKATFFPQFEAQTLVMLLGLLSNDLAWLKTETLYVLQHLMPHIDLQRPEFIGVGADLISPLLRLLLTDYAASALEVLDQCVAIPGSQLDRDVLRMSLGNASMKKEYERTATLFGIPEDSGWAIPMPAITASTTRNNVHAVFSTCASTTKVDDGPADDTGEEFHFHREDYAPPHTHDAATLDDPEAASLSHMYAALDDFDSFFTKDNDIPPLHRTSGPQLGSPRALGHTHSVSADHTGDTLSPLDSAPFVYDKKASVILNRSLARTPSNTSFKTNLADSIGGGYVSSVPMPVMGKRSYIPFRNSRYHPHGYPHSTPISGDAATFEPPTAISTPNIGHSTGGPGDIPGDEVDAEVSTAVTMFDSILGSKKKTKRQNKSNPSLNDRAMFLPGSSPNVKAKRRASQKFK